MRGLRLPGLLVAITVALGGAFATPACGSSDNGFDSSDGASGNGDEGGGGNADANGTGPGTFGMTDSSVDSSMPPLTAGDSGLACATSSTQATPLPLDLFFMVDTSASMGGIVAQGAPATAANTTTKYQAVVGAFKQFVNDPSSGGIGVDLQFFPTLASGATASCTTDGQCANGTGPCDLNFCDGKFTTSVTYCKVKQDCSMGANCAAPGICSLSPEYFCPGAANGLPCGTANGFDLGTCVKQTTGRCDKADSCTAADYVKSIVADAPLPGNAAAFVAALNAHTPAGNTPTSAALQGAVTKAEAFQLSHPGHTGYVVFATDGLPSECDTSIANIANIASTGLTNGVKTYVIGVFTAQDGPTAKPNLDQIAAAGGTTQAMIVTAGSTTGTDFLAALNAIRATQLPCQYKLPTPPDGGMPDYSNLNVAYTSSKMVASVIGYRSAVGMCDPNSGGWYFDKDPMTGGTPTEVILCPSTCTAVQKDMSGGRVDVLLGCKTIVDAGTPSNGGIK